MKKILKIAIILLIILTILQIEKDFKNREIFNVKNVEIIQNGFGLKKDLNRLKNMILGKNIHNLDLNSIEKLYEKDIRVDKILIRREGINGIIIRLLEKVPKYYAQYKNRVYVLDRDGNIIGEMREFSKDGLPILSFNREDEKNQLLNVLNSFVESEYMEEISQIYRKDNNTILIILKDGTIIKTNEDVKKDRYELAMNLYRGLIKEKKLEYMDMRFEDIVIKEREEDDAG